jgi:hypothetical protein
MIGSATRSVLESEHPWISAPSIRNVSMALNLRILPGSCLLSTVSLQPPFNVRWLLIFMLVLVASGSHERWREERDKQTEKLRRAD